MSDYFELDFMDVESPKSGDAIPLRYCHNGVTQIHTVDGGFQATGESVVNHIKKYYGTGSRVDHVIATHPDGDHAGGLRTVLEQLEVGQLWMLRPWMYASELIGRFPSYASSDRLAARLRSVYPNLAALEAIAIDRHVPIAEPFQGAAIGAFTVLAPSKSRYLDLIVSSERTPESEAAKERTFGFTTFLEKAITLIRTAWGIETFSPQETSAENEMSVVQFAEICGKRLLLTADAGRASLTEAADYAISRGVLLPGIDRFQVPHHGSRRNVSSELLDRWLGPRLPARLAKGAERFHAFISSALKDEAHPRKAVVRALIHRGATVFTTEGKCVQTQQNAPARGWYPVASSEYPEEQEE